MSKRKRAGPRRVTDFSIAQLRPHFPYPLKEAAVRLGTCEAVLKRICRRKGLKRWPFRQVEAIRSRIEYNCKLMRHVDEATAARTKLKIDRLKQQHDEILGTNGEPIPSFLVINPNKKSMQQQKVILQPAMSMRASHQQTVQRRILPNSDAPTCLNCCVNFVSMEDSYCQNCKINGPLVFKNKFYASSSPVLPSINHQLNHATVCMELPTLKTTTLFHGTSLSILSNVAAVSTISKTIAFPRTSPGHSLDYILNND
jgi:hypothetical protein